MSSNSENWRLQPDPQPPTQQPSYELVDIEDDEFSCILPSSPNWYCSNILSCLNGYAAFGGKNAVFMINMRTRPPVCDWCMNGTTFSMRVTAVALMNLLVVTEESSSSAAGGAGGGVDHIAFASEDGLLKIVDLKEKRVVKDLKKHMVKVTCLEWSLLRKEVLVSADEKGVILVWDFVEKKCNVWTPLTSSVTCMALSSHDPDVGLFGYMNGNIIVGDTKKLLVLYTFKDNINEVYSLSWNQTLNGRDLFVSSSKDKSIRIFHCGEQKNTQTFFLPRNISPNNKNVNKGAYQGKTFFTVLWLSETQIVSSYSGGELLAWDTGSGKWRQLNNGHNRLVYSMCRDNLTDQFVSVSIDRMIIFHDTNTLKPTYKLPSFGGFIYSLSNTPHDPHSLAAGVGDNTIRVWKSGRRDKPYANTCVWQGIKTKVTIIECHPNREGIVAYGTDDGHVGCYSSITQKSDVSQTYHKKTVYALAWGPSCCCVEDNGGECLNVSDENTTSFQCPYGFYTKNYVSKYAELKKSSAFR